MDEIVTRFAPSPTGHLHLGHAASALYGWRLARAHSGRWLVRMEDLDADRCRPDFEAAILEDLAWLGLIPDGPVLRQSTRAAAHADALAKLRALGVVYPCQCSRADIAAASTAPHDLLIGPDGPLYPGTCRRRPASTENAAWRLDTARAAARTGPLAFEDAALGTVAVVPDLLGDIVVARRDAGLAYHLAVVVDDAHQRVTDVVRGEDLRPATHPQRLLQALLGLPTPRYHHHGLVWGPDGKRLAKRDAALALATLRARGVTPEQVIAEVQRVADVALQTPS
jgi:glutamyl-Q tRNA(Asp) synthetase